MDLVWLSYRLGTSKCICQGRQGQGPLDQGHVRQRIGLVFRRNSHRTVEMYVKPRTEEVTMDTCNEVRDAFPQQ